MWKRLRNKYRYSVLLLRELVRADFKVKYQDSALGYLWSVLQPLFLFTILYAVFAVGLRIGGDIENWPVAMLAGVVLWQFFADVTKSGLKTIVNNGGLLRKIKFPRYTIVISGTISSFVTLLINSVVVVVFAMINGVPVLSTMPLAILLVAEVFVFSLGVAFLLSAVYVKFRDIEYIWEILVRGLFYASAIIYPISVIVNLGQTGGIVAQALLMNPVAQAIQDVRHLAINPEIDSLWTISGGNIFLYMIPVVISLFAFIIGAWYFHKKAPSFAEDI